MVQIYKELSRTPALGKHWINNSFFFFSTLAWEELKYKNPFCLEDSAFLYAFFLSALTDPFVPNYSSIGLTKITERLSLRSSLWKKENFDGDIWVSISSRFQWLQLRLNKAAQSRRLVGSLGHESGMKSPQGGLLVMQIPQPRVALARWGVPSQPFDKCTAPGPGNHRRWDSHGLIISEDRYPPQRETLSSPFPAKNTIATNMEMPFCPSDVSAFLWEGEQMCVQTATSYPNGEVAHMPRSHCSLQGKSVKEHWHLGAQEETKIMASGAQWPLARSEIRSLPFPQKRAMALPCREFSAPFSTPAMFLHVFRVASRV